MTYQVLIAVSMKVTAVTFRRHLFRSPHPKRMQEILQISDKLVHGVSDCRLRISTYGHSFSVKSSDLRLLLRYLFAVSD